MDAVRRRGDVIEHPWEVAPAVEERFDRGGDRGGVGLGEIDPADPRVRDDLGGQSGGAFGLDRIGVEGIARDALLAVAQERAGRGDTPGPEGDRPSPTHDRADPVRTR